jgi:hypothetical protein
VKAAAMSTATGKAGTRTDNASRRQKKRKKGFHDRYPRSGPPTFPFNQPSEKSLYHGCRKWTDFAQGRFLQHHVIGDSPRCVDALRFQL